MDRAERDDTEERVLGYRTASARDLGLREWASLRGARGEKYGDPKAFRGLVARLLARKYWAAKSPEARARIRAYRARWRLMNIEHVRAYFRAYKRAHGPTKGEAAARRRKRAVEKRERHAARVHTCEVCGAQWCSPLYMVLPKRPITVCGLRCRGRRTVAYRKTFGLCIHCARPAREGRVSCALHASSASRRKKVAA